MTKTEAAKIKTLRLVALLEPVTEGQLGTKSRALVDLTDLLLAGQKIGMSRADLRRELKTVAEVGTPTTTRGTTAIFGALDALAKLDQPPPPAPDEDPDHLLAESHRRLDEYPPAGTSWSDWLAEGRQLHLRAIALLEGTGSTGVLG